MKKKEKIRSMLGLTQQDMALLLKISRSLLSLHEMGLRNLSSEAGIRLNEMFSYMITLQAKAPQNLPNMEKEEGKIKQILKERLEENEFQIFTITRKIDGLQQKLKEYEKASQLLHFLCTPEEVKKALEPRALPVVKSHVNDNYTKTKSELILLQIDLEPLQLQQECYVKALHKLESSY